MSRWRIMSVSLVLMQALLLAAFAVYGEHVKAELRRGCVGPLIQAVNR